MTTTNPLYVIGPSMEMAFLDKDTGAPLSSGLVYFYSDINRTTKKPIFTQVDTPSPYTYVQLPNPVVLSIFGTFQDDNENNVIPYYYPYDANGNQELYYIEVFSSVDGINPDILQFTREAWPPSGFIDQQQNNEASAIVNYIPNGQFLLHNTIPATQTNIAGLITQAVTPIAQGGWTFERPADSTAIDTVNFTRFNSSVQNPTGNPRYAVTINNTSPNPSDAYKRLCVSFRDVNKFASTSQIYTFSFSATSTGNVDLSLNLIKNFGTGGTPTNPEVIEPVGDAITVTGAYTIYTFQFVFGVNDAYVIGTNDDDTVQIALYFPTNLGFNISLTDFTLQIGDIIVSAFIDETDADMTIRSVAYLPVPASDGSDLYCPIVMTQEGGVFDKGQIGIIEAVIGNVVSPNNNTAYTNLMPCDGAQYLTSARSYLGIPYSRLYSYLSQNSSIGLSAYGTGLNYATLYPSSFSNNVGYITNNTYGSGAIAANGTSSPGFSFTQQSPGLSANNGKTAVMYSANYFYVYQFGLTAADVNSGIIIVLTRNGQASGINFFSFNTTSMNVPALAGTYFQINGPVSNVYVWFKYNGAGTDPAGLGTGIQIDLYTGDTVSDVALLCASAINGGTITEITTTAASTIPQNSWWGFTTANTNKYYVWYDFGTGTSDPKPASYTLGIKVNLLTSDTAAEVLNKTTIAVNSTYFRAPPLQGLFLRGYDPNQLWNLDSGSNFGFSGENFGNNVFTFQTDQFTDHNHTAVVTDAGSTATSQLNGGNVAGGLYPAFTQQNTGAAPSNAVSTSLNLRLAAVVALNGGSETRPFNANVTWAIKY